MTPFWILWSLSCLHKVKTASWDLSFGGKWQAIAFPGGCFNLLQLFNLGYSLIFFHAFSLTRICYLQVFPFLQKDRKEKTKTIHLTIDKHWFLSGDWKRQFCSPDNHRWAVIRRQIRSSRNCHLKVKLLPCSLIYS